MERSFKKLDTIVKIANQWQTEQQKNQKIWTDIEKQHKMKLKMIKKQMEQMQALNDSLKQENERLWAMISPIVTKQNKQVKQIECIDLSIEPENVPIKIEKNIDENMHVIKSISEQESLEIEQEEQSEVEHQKEEEEHVAEQVHEEAKEEEPSEITSDNLVETEVVETEKVEEEEVEETEEEEAVEEETEEVEETEEEVEEEEEVFVVTIDGKEYFTTNEKNGMIYEMTADGDVGEELGYYEDGEPGFYE